MRNVLMIAIAGTDTNFLLSMPTLKAYMYQFEDVRCRYDLIIYDYKESTLLCDILQDIQNTEYDILCLSSYIWNKERIEGILQYETTTPIIIGGPDIPSKLNPNVTKVDGFGEEAFYKLLMKKDPPKQSYAEYPSVYLTGAVNQRTLNNESLYVTLETSRGCNNRCAYCMYYKTLNKIIYRDPLEVIDELDYLYSIVGKKTSNILDSNFFANEQHALTILNGITERHIKMKICIGVISSFITLKLIQACKNYLAQGGDLLICIGIQSTNNTVLKEIQRPLLVKPLFEAQIKQLQDAGVMMGLDLIIALPKDTKESYYASVEYLCTFMRYNRAYPNCNILHIIDNTTIAERVEQYHYVLDEFNRVISSPTMTHDEIVDCMLVSLVIRRLFDPSDIDAKRYEVRHAFFSALERQQCTSITLIEQILTKIKVDLFGQKFGSNMPDQRLLQTQMRTDIPYKWLLENL